MFIIFQDGGCICVSGGQGFQLLRMFHGGFPCLCQGVLANGQHCIRVEFLPVAIPVFRSHDFRVIVNAILLYLRLVIIPVRKLLLVEGQIELLDDGGMRGQMTGLIPSYQAFERVCAKNICAVCTFIAELFIIFLRGGTILENHPAEAFEADG